MTSVLNVDSIAAKDGTSPVALTKQSAAKAWNHFDGTGTVAIDNSFNISSLIDSTTGQYASAFTNNMSSTQYPNTGHSRHDGGVNALFSTSNKDNYPPITSSCGIDSFSSDGNQNQVDSDQMSQVIHGDLA